MDSKKLQKSIVNQNLYAKVLDDLEDDVPKEIQDNMNNAFLQYWQYVKTMSYDNNVNKFLNDETKNTGNTPLCEVYNRYLEYCHRNPCHRVLTKKHLSIVLESLGYEKYKSGGWLWRNLSFK